MSDTVDFNIETPDTIDFDLTVGDVTVSQDHRDLTHRDAVNQHPINAISGLQTALDGKQATIPANTYDAYGAASSAVTTHNSSAQAHNSLFNDKQDKLPTPVNNYFLHANASTGALEWAAGGGGGGGTGDHTQLTNRDAANQHPISAVTDLQTNLDKKVMGYIEYGTPTTILDTTTLNFTAGTSYATGLYQSTQNAFPDLTLGHLYRITWDGTDYDCLWFQGIMSGTADSRLGSANNTWTLKVLGNVSDINSFYSPFENNNTPFSLTANWARNSGRYIWTKNTSSTHTVKIVDLNVTIHSDVQNLFLPKPYTDVNQTNGYQSLITGGKKIGSICTVGTVKNEGEYATSFGIGTVVTGDYAIAEGLLSVASGQASHAEGSSVASGKYSHAAGQSCVASGVGSYASGAQSTASGAYSHAEGGQNTASAWGAHVEGFQCTASGMMAHAEGSGSLATKTVQHVSGMYNIEDTGSQSWGSTTVGNYLEIVGNGTAANARSNAYALGMNGTGHYKGDLYTGCNADSTGGNKVATESWVGQQGYLTQHQSLAAYRTSAAQDVIDATKANASDLDAVEEKIPAQATSSNKLADKDFVNSSINSVTAYYITKDAQGSQFATYAELAAATTFYSGGVVRVPTRNDYCIVQADENHQNATTRYIYQNNQWEFQYVVNETALTSDQLAALNSGITSSAVTKLNDIESGAQVNDVTNVQIDGISILSSGVANIPKASTSNLGVVKGSNWYGIYINPNNGIIQITKADNSDINARTHQYEPIVPSNLDYAVKAAMCDGVGAAWSTSEQTAALTRLGITMPTVTRL